MSSLKKNRSRRNEDEKNLDALRGNDLDKYSVLDILGLDDKLGPIAGCKGPSLSEWNCRKRKITKKRLTEILQERRIHLLEGSHNDKKKMLVLNNAFNFLLGEDILSRFRFWLKHSKDIVRDGHVRPSCSNVECKKTEPVEEERTAREVLLSPSGSRVPGRNSEALENDLIVISTDDESSESGALDKSASSGVPAPQSVDGQPQTSRPNFRDGTKYTQNSAAGRIQSNSAASGMEMVETAISPPQSRHAFQKYLRRQSYVCEGCGRVSTRDRLHPFAQRKKIDHDQLYLEQWEHFQEKSPHQMIEAATKFVQKECVVEDLLHLSVSQLELLFQGKLRKRYAITGLGLGSHDEPDKSQGSDRDAPAADIDTALEAAIVAMGPACAVKCVIDLGISKVTAIFRRNLEEHRKYTEALSQVIEAPVNAKLPSPGVKHLLDLGIPVLGSILHGSLMRCYARTQGSDQHVVHDLPDLDASMPGSIRHSSPETHHRHASVDQAIEAFISKVQPSVLQNFRHLDIDTIGSMIRDKVEKRSAAEYSRPDPTDEAEETPPDQDALAGRTVTGDNGGAKSIPRDNVSASPVSPTPIQSSYKLPRQMDGGKSSAVNPSTASPSPTTSSRDRDIDLTPFLPSPPADCSHDGLCPSLCEDEDEDPPPANGRISMGPDMSLNQEPSATASDVASSRTDNSITVSQVSCMSIQNRMVTTRKRPIGDEDTEISGTKAKKARLNQGSPAEGNASVMDVTQVDEAEGHIIFASSCGGSDAASNALKDSTYVLGPSAGAESSTAGPSTAVPPLRLSSSSGQSNEGGSNAHQPSPSSSRHTVSNECAYTFDDQTKPISSRCATTTYKEHLEVSPLYTSNDGNSYPSLPRNDMRIVSRNLVDPKSSSHAQYPSQEKEQPEPYEGNKQVQSLHSTEMSDLYEKNYDLRSCSTPPIELNGFVNLENVQDHERTPWLANKRASVHNGDFDAEAEFSRNQAKLDTESHPEMPATETTLGCHQEYQNQNGDHLTEAVTYKYISSQAAISYLQESKLGLPRAMLAGDTTHSWLTYFPVKSAIEILESFESEDGEWRDFTPCPLDFRDSEECLNLLSKNLDQVSYRALFMKFPGAKMSHPMPCHLVFFPSLAVGQALAQLPSFHALSA
ncbi:hypothetical protein FOXG_20948 [Fusarium oxysporum f. sp. lycopersici 4287]|uniref:Uncharacterized protein n=1 Tax=Fusarium oxysporum f. sp. lycopersici (strain 4287 / CBS 123668 / FGSC 9935 / NRRL 34936) TaxID=426428 RepID=A0A0J9VSL3_FUSO4|nr:hypothetical protein FOXG_20948 [Fusarium oxysporum f. sp. lycopersici 4287]EWZ78189.1 hypothetical protein FOWG_17491 [Fusarium oxysporum f. sp. lycopersici MN25]KNB13843.1 hypothetical protein FOXG_20948 [Fusarium oxysporum f. sp. lycopersici 4287]